MPGATPTYGLPYQTLDDPPHGPNLGQDLAEAVETELARIETAKPYVRVTKTTGLPSTISTSGWTKIQYSAIEKSTVSGMWSAGTPTRIFAPIAGDYTIKGVVGWSSSPGVTGCFVGVIKNGAATPIWRGNKYPSTPSGSDTHTFEIDLALSAGDYLEVQVTCVGASGNLSNGDNSNLWAALEWKRA